MQAATYPSSGANQLTGRTRMLTLDQQLRALPGGCCGFSKVGEVKRVHYLRNPSNYLLLNKPCLT